jgi:DDE superfamily endonuclease
MGCSTQRHFQNYHRVLNRAVWSGRRASFLLLLRMLLAKFAPSGPLVLGLDATIKRRWGAIAVDRATTDCLYQRTYAQHPDPLRAI